LVTDAARRLIDVLHVAWWDAVEVPATTDGVQV